MAVLRRSVPASPVVTERTTRSILARNPVVSIVTGYWRRHEKVKEYNPKERIPKTKKHCKTLQAVWRPIWFS